MNASVILPAQLIGLFDMFLAVLNEPNGRVERTDAFIYVVLATIPWVDPDRWAIYSANKKLIALSQAAAELHYRTPNELTRVLTTIEQYMNVRKANAHKSGIAAALEALKPYRDLPEGRPYEQGDVSVRQRILSVSCFAYFTYNGHLAAFGTSVGSNQTTRQCGRMECTYTLVQV